MLVSGTPGQREKERKKEMKNENTVATGKSQVASESAVAADIQNIANGSTPLLNVEEALAILATSKSRASGGSKIRPNVGYTLVAEKMSSLRNTSVPEQEQVIVKILLRALTTQKPVISEVELNKLVVAAHTSGALKTKQDAWHIFRYYRTDLVKRGVLKQVEIAA